MPLRDALPAALLLVLVAGCGSSDGTKFADRVDNPWFPLKPGTTLHYSGEVDGEPATDVFTVTHATKTILGARTTVVHDRVFVRGHLEEETFDYYAQDEHGTVWYFGEDTRELDARGRVKSREGTWRAGVDGARAGIFMPANPKVGQSFAQEHYPGHAEDRCRIVSIRSGTLRTREWTPLEPGVLDEKVYRRGVGTVLERTLEGGDEFFRLDRS